MQMFRTTFVYLLVILTTCQLFGMTSLHITKQFNLAEFKITQNDNKMTEIDTDLMDVYFGEPYMPSIPEFEIRYALPCNTTIDSIKYIATKVKIGENIVLSTNYPPVHFNDSWDSTNMISRPTYPLGVYPQTACKIRDVTSWNTINVAYIRISPFEYNAAEKTLYFRESFQIEMTLKELARNEQPNKKKISPSISTIVKSIVDNPEQVDDYLYDDNPLVSQPISSADSDDSDNVEYLIITSDSLAASFEPLRRWRERTGLHSRIVTTEEVYSASNLPTCQQKIKSYIQRLYTNKNLTYVLLGGDDTVVPTQYCQAKVTSVDSVHTDFIPSDVFYASTEGSFDWDANKNGIVGEKDEDGVSQSLSLYVSRLPARTSKDVKSMIDKILSYEKHPQWHGKMLLAGNKLTHNPNDEYQNDAELQSIQMYRAYVDRGWTGDTVCFFDSHTSFEGDATFDVTPSNFHKVIGGGYEFITMASHGNTDRWSMESEGAYTSALASTLTNKGNSIFFTASCNTNAFDHNETQFASGCLSESLLRNPNSGICLLYTSPSPRDS